MSKTIQALRASARRNSRHSVTTLSLAARTVLSSFIPSTSAAPKPAMLSASSSQPDRAKRQARPASNGMQRMAVRSMRSPFEFVELADVHRGESLADAKDEDAQHHDGDNDIEEDADLDHERHSVGRQGNGGEHDAV